MKIDVIDNNENTVFSQDFSMDAGDITLGRESDCTIVLADDMISPHHAVIHLSNRGISITDSDSINGVSINGKRIATRSVPLKCDDTIELAGWTVKLSGDFPNGSQPARTRILALLLVLMVLLGALLLVAKLHKNLPEAQQQAAAAQATPVPTPTLPPIVKRIDEAMSQLMKGERAYFNNHIDEAANYFRQAISTYSNVPVAAAFLDQLQHDYVPFYLNRAYNALSAKKMPDLRVAVTHLQALAPTDPEVTELLRLVAGQYNFNSARKLLSNGNYMQAQQLLEQSKMLNDSQRISLLQHIDRLTDFEQQQQHINSFVNQMEVEKALTLVQELSTRPDLPNGWQKLLQDTLHKLERLIQFESAAADDNHYETVILGRDLLLELTGGSWTGPVALVQTTLEQRRLHWCDSAAELTASAAVSFNEATVQNNKLTDAASAHAMRDAIEALTILQFINPQDNIQQQLEQSQDILDAYVRDTYQQAYIMQSREQANKAAAIYRNVLDAALFDSPYAARAEKQLAQLETAQQLINTLSLEQ